MRTDLQHRLLLTELIENHLNNKDPDYEQLLGIAKDPSRPVPIRGVLESIRRYSSTQLTESELKTIDDLLYLYG
ncbi:hypothetical protein KVQ74_11175 [Pseudomonas sp. COW3]|nr:hypothetical protein [Pseudomonas botevensis]